MKATTAACVLVVLLALVQLPAFDARDLKDGTHSQCMQVGTSDSAGSNARPCLRRYGDAAEHAKKAALTVLSRFDSNGG